MTPLLITACAVLVILGCFAVLFAWGWFCVYKLPDPYNILVYVAPFFVAMVLAIHFCEVVPRYEKAKAAKNATAEMAK